MKMIDCPKCRRRRQHYAKGLCKNCYNADFRSADGNIAATEDEKIVTLDFSEDPDLWETICMVAREERRSPRAQIMWVLDRFAEDEVSVKAKEVLEGVRKEIEERHGKPPLKVV
jgi:hypothetical protein